MANWYDIPGIEFVRTMPRDADNHILFEGVEDDAGVVVEDTMWERFAVEMYDEMVDADPCELEDLFCTYVRGQEDEVKDLIRMARGQLAY